MRPGWNMWPSQRCGSRFHLFFRQVLSCLTDNRLFDMGLYATLLEAPLPCPNCGRVLNSEWQFYFGGVADLPRYRLGDQVRWDGPAQFGDVSMTLVSAVADCVNEPACTSCPVESLVVEIVIEDGWLRSLSSPHIAWHACELLFEGPDQYPRFHDDLYRA